VDRPHTKIHTRRWLIFTLLLVTAYQLGEILSATTSPLDVHLLFSPAARLIVGIVWALLFGLAVVLIIRRTNPALPYTAALLVAYSAYSVARVMIFTQADYNHERLPSLIGIILIFLSIPFYLSIRLMRAQNKELTQTETLTDGSQPQNSES